MGEADPFLWLLRTNPDLMPEASCEWTPQEMDERRREGRPCMRCGEPADQTIIALTNIGPRWLDLCAKDRHWVVVNSTGDAS